MVTTANGFAFKPTAWMGQMDSTIAIWTL